MIDRKHIHHKNVNNQVVVVVAVVVVVVVNMPSQTRTNTSLTERILLCLICCCCLEEDDIAHFYCFAFLVFFSFRSRSQERGSREQGRVERRVGVRVARR